MTTPRQEFTAVAGADGLVYALGGAGDEGDALADVEAYDPRTGDEIWKVTYSGYSVIPRPVYGHGMVFLSTGYESPEVLAIEARQVHVELVVEPDDAGPAVLGVDHRAGEGRAGPRRPARRARPVPHASTTERTHAASRPEIISIGSPRGRHLLAPGQPRVDGAADLTRVAADLLAALMEDGPLGREVLGRDERHVPRVGEPRRDAQRALLAAPADHDGRARALHRLGLAARIGEPVVATVERRLLEAVASS